MRFHLLLLLTVCSVLLYELHISHPWLAAVLATAIFWLYIESSVQ